MVNPRLIEREEAPFGALEARRRELASEGKTVVCVAVDGRAAGLLAIADAPRPTFRAGGGRAPTERGRGCDADRRQRGNRRRVAGELGISTVVAEELPADKASRVAELQHGGRRVAMVGDGVNDASALAQADLGIAIGAGTDVAVETADVVLMRSDPLDVPTALAIRRGTLRKMRQNLGRVVGYNAIALPIAAGVFKPAFGLEVRPEIAAISMSGSSLIVAVTHSCCGGSASHSDQGRRQDDSGRDAPGSGSRVR